MKKRLLSILLALSMMLSLLPGTAWAADATSGTCGVNLTWTLEDGVLTISGTGAMDDYTNLETAPWYESRGRVTTVTVTDGVTSIGKDAFAYCAISSVTIPNSVTSIGDSAFAGCGQLTSVTIPNSVTSIGYALFGGCTGLTNVTIPSSVTSIGESPFYNCPSLTIISLSEGNNEYSSVNGVLFNKDRSILIAYPAGKSDTSYAIPDSVTNIGNGAFTSCSSLTSVYIPDSVTSIGMFAFDMCVSLKDVYYGGNEVQWKQISTEGGNAYLLNATIHYNGTDSDDPGSGGNQGVRAEVQPEVLYSGTVDPVIQLYAYWGRWDGDEPSWGPDLDNISVDTGRTGLTYVGGGWIGNTENGSTMYMFNLRGTAREGTVTITLDDNVSRLEIEVPVLPGEGREDDGEDGRITFSAEPKEIYSGTVDPVIHLYSDDFNQFSTIALQSGTTGLSLAESERVSDTEYIVYLRGTAYEGTLTIELTYVDYDDGEWDLWIPGSRKLEIPVLPGEGRDDEEQQITFSVEPKEIHGGTVDPIIHVYTNHSYWDYRYGVNVDTGSTGLNDSGPKIIVSNDGLELTVYLYGTAREGTATIALDDYVLRIPVVPAEKSTYEERIEDAVGLVEQYVAKMTNVEKEDSTSIDLATLYAESVVADAISMQVGAGPIQVSASSVSELVALADEAVKKAEAALIQGGVTPHRELSPTITLNTRETNVEIQVSPDLLESGADKIRVQAADYALTFKAADLKDDLSNILTFKAEPIYGDGPTLASRYTDAPDADPLLMNSVEANIEQFYAAAAKSMIALDVTLPGGGTVNPITVSMPCNSSKDTTYQVLVDSTGSAYVSKYNPATGKIDGKVNTSGIYSVAINEMNFSDIANKSTEMQQAIKYLAARGVIKGTSAMTYSPDGSFSRAELIELVIKALGKINNADKTTFSDVTRADWFYSSVASGQRLGYVNGLPDNTFRGRNVLSKVEIVVFAAQVLSGEMKFKTPANTATTLSKYSDTVASWAQPQVALATRENLVPYRTDGTFSGGNNMTRGDAAIIVYRLFQKIW